MLFITIFTGVLLVPSLAFAWGPLTHIYLGNEIFTYAPLIPAGIMSLLKKYRQDFLYGNLMADMILGKKYLPDERSSHNWDFAIRLLEQSKSGSEKAFIYGYLSHLAADTVAHEALTEDRRHMGHTWIELKADSVIDKTYWLQYMTISRVVKKRNDRFLEGSLESLIFSSRTNKRIYKGIVLLSFLNKKRKRGIDRRHIKKLHNESISRMLDLLQNGRESAVLNKRPL